MPSVHRKGRKQFSVRLTQEQRRIFEEAQKASGAKDLSTYVIETILAQAKQKGIQ